MKIKWIALAIWMFVVSIAGQDEVKIKLDVPEKFRSGEKSFITVHVEVAKNWHLYSPEEQAFIPFKIKPAPINNYPSNNKFTFTNAPYPKGHKTKLFGEQVYLYEKSFSFKWPVTADKDIASGKHKLALSVSYQVCSNSTCLPPVIDSIIEISTIVEGGSDKQESSENSQKTTPEDETVEPLDNSLLFNLLTAFIGGLLTSLTPCVYPMIPITIAFFTAQSKDKSQVGVLKLVLVFVLGIATLYTALGVFTGLFKKNFNVLLQSVWVLGGLAAIFFLLGLSFFGVFTLQLPSFITNRAQVTRGGYFGAYTRGLFLGIIAAPCMGPVSVTILALVPQSPVLGGLLLFVYAIGVGVLFVFLAMFSKSLPKAGRWQHSVELLLGIVIIGVGVFFLETLVSLKVLAVIIGVLFVAFGAYLIGDMKNHKSKGKMVMIVLAFIVALVFLPGFAFKTEGIPLPEFLLKKAFFYGDWEKDFDKGMKLAQKEGKPVMVDVWAKWCLPCRAMDATTFKEPEVVEELKRFVKIKLDITLQNEENQKVLDKYKIPGPPSFLFFDGKGKLVKVYKGKVNTKTILSTLKEVR